MEDWVIVLVVIVGVGGDRVGKDGDTPASLAELGVDGDAVTPLYVLAVVTQVGLDALSVVFWDVSFVKCNDMAWVGCREASFVSKSVWIVIHYTYLIVGIILHWMKEGLTT